MEKIACISFPRSGHHLLINALMKYFSQDVSYQEIEDSTRCRVVYQAGALFYCEHYDHCQTHPCPDIRTNLQKHHDFQLDLECQYNKQLIQIRHPIESIISYYKYCYGINEYANNNWQNFARDKATYWKRFVQKWIIQNDCTNSKVVLYNDIINFPSETISSAISYLEPKDRINYDLVEKIVCSLNIQRKTKINDFVYYDESFLSEIEDSLDLEMKYLKMGFLFAKAKRNIRVEHKQNEAIIATSLAPGNEKIQRAAIESWKANGFEVVSLNSKNEIERIRSSYAGINFIEVGRTAGYIFGKPYIFLNDILDFLSDSDASLCGIVNSDIIMSNEPGIKAKLLSEVRDRSLVYASRIEIKNLSDFNGSIYNAGFDLFFFSPMLCKRMPQSLASMGVTWWDYWFPLFAALKGYRLKKLDSSIGYHVSHATNWSDDQWRFMGLHIAQALYHRRAKNGLDKFEDDVFKKLEVMILNAAYYSLSMAPNIHDKIYSSYFSLPALAKAILAFLNTESIPISFSMRNREQAKFDNNVEKLNTKADNEIMNNRLESAYSILCDAFSVDPDNPRTLCNLGTVFLKKNNYQKALSYFKLCLVKNPYHPVATHNCGMIAMQRGDNRLAEKLFSIYLHQNPWDLTIGALLLEIKSNMHNGYKSSQNRQSSIIEQPS